MDSSLPEHGTFSDTYRRFSGALAGVSEPTPPSPRPGVRERLVRCLWFDQTFDSESFRTAGGEKVRVLTPGWWNLEKGPDFLKAAVRIGRGETLHGDVEVHVYASDWTRHGHQSDPAYSSVILHVVFWNDLQEAAVRNVAGAVVPIAELAPFVSTPVDELAETVDSSEYPELAPTSSGPCREALTTRVRPADWLGRFLDAAGDERILRKKERMEVRVGGRALDEALYEGLAEQLGAKQNRAQMLQLARLAPYPVLRQIASLRSEGAALRCQAVLFALSGLLPAKDEHAVGDGESAEHLFRLHEEWESVCSLFSADAMSARQWCFSSTRPVNFPTRRIAALGALVAASASRGLLQTLLDMLQCEKTDRTARVRHLWLRWLENLPDQFWSRRCTFTGKVFARPVRLIGKDRANALLVDVVLPALLLHARLTSDRPLERLIHALFTRYPVLPESTVTRFMKRRLFGDRGDGEKIISSARRQQGLYQLFHDCCEKGDLACRRCILVSAVNQGAL